MKPVPLSLLFLLLSVQVFGQTPKDLVREWDKGSLCNEDFVLSPQGDSAYFSVVWIKDPVRVKKGSATYWYLDIKNAFLPASTYVGKEGLTKEQMLLFQREFDLSEKYVRILRDSLLWLSAKVREERWKQGVSDFFTERRGQAGQSDVDACPGPDNFDITALPMKHTPLGASFYLGGDFSLPLGAMGTLSGPLAGFFSGLDLKYGRFFLAADLSYRKGCYKGDYIGIKGVGEKGSDAYQFLWRVGPGIVLCGDEDWRLSTFVAFGRSRTRLSPDPVSDFLLSEGLRFEWGLHKSYRLYSVLPGLFQSNLFSRLYMDQVWIAGNGTFSPSVNLSIGIDFLVNGLSRD